MVLEGEGVGGFNVDIFVSSKASIPKLAGAATLQIIETPGSGPERTQNAVTTAAYQRPSAQITARADTYVLAMAKARAAYDALVKVRNQFVNSTWYREINPLQEPFELGGGGLVDAAGQLRIVFNVNGNRRPTTGAGTIMLQQLIADFGGEAFGFQVPPGSDVYPSGATFDKLVPGSSPVVVNALKLPAGTYVLEASAKVAAAGARVKVGLFNLTTAPDTPMTEITFTTSELLGERLRSAAVTLPSADNVLGVKLAVNSTTINGAAWGCRIIRI